MKTTKLIAVVMISTALSACGSKETAEPATEAKTTVAAACGSAGGEEERDTLLSSETDTQTVQESEPPAENASGGEEDIDGAPDENHTVDLETIAELLEMSDPQAAEVFGGGKENWTEDKKFYIGRIYQVKLFDRDVTVYTSYDDKQLVNSVSIWLVNGEQKVQEEDAVQWVERLNEFTGTEPVSDDTASESGSRNWKWFLGERAVALNWIGDMLTISMNVVVGELD